MQRIEINYIAQCTLYSTVLYSVYCSCSLNISTDICNGFIRFYQIKKEVAEILFKSTENFRIHFRLDISIKIVDH